MGKPLTPEQTAALKAALAECTKNTLCNALLSCHAANSKGKDDSYYYYYYSDYSYYEDECLKFNKSDCGTQQNALCSWRNDKCQKKVPEHSFNFTGYNAV